jgi:hypothetical protein
MAGPLGRPGKGYATTFPQGGALGWANLGPFGATSAVRPQAMLQDYTLLCNAFRYARYAEA